MAAATLAGLGWGALHAVTAPDHVLSLAPVCGRRSAWRVGLWWGSGHAVGTLVWAAAAAAATRLGAGLLDTAWPEAAARVAAGLVLVATGVMGWRRRHRVTHPGAGRPRAAVLVGALHGLTGAAAVLMAAPALAGDALRGMGWVGGFTLGSTVAMCALTAVLGAGALALSQRALGNAVAAASVGSVALGVAWLTTMLP
jgi:hypothetical protein